MRAWVCHDIRPDRSGLAFETAWPDPPPPAAGEVGVRLTACALNFPDVLMLSGEYQFRPETPYIPGMEAAGVVEAAGDGVPRDLIGRRVVIGARTGGLAERITLPASAVRPVPGALTDAEAAAHGVGALTAYVGLKTRGRLAAGERVLVLGAGGGMGLAAVAVGEALGAHVTAAASGEAKLAAARAAGADATLLLDRDAPDLSALKGAIDVVFDPVGGAAVPAALATLRWGGRYLVIGFVGGRPEPVPLNRLLLKGVEIVGVRAGEYGRRDPAAARAHLAAIDALAERGLTAHIGLRVPLDRADEAFAAMAAGELVGKAVVEIA